MKKWLYLVLALSVLMPASNAMAISGLDNSAWQAQEEGKKKTDDHLLFMNGEFVSSGCVPYGFTTTSYSASNEGDKVKWSATQTNPENEKMVWTGQAAGDKMTGKYVYTDKKGKTWTQAWSAKKMEKE